MDWGNSLRDADEAGVRVQLLGPGRAWRGDDELELTALTALTALRQLTGPGRYALQDLRADTAHVARAEAAGGSRAPPREPWPRGARPVHPPGLPKALLFLVYD